FPISAIRRPEWGCGSCLAEGPLTALGRCRSLPILRPTHSIPRSIGAPKAWSMQHLTKRFEAAVRELVADGPIKQRLVLAFGRHLEDLVSADLPEPLREPFAALHAALHSADPI